MLTSIPVTLAVATVLGFLSGLGIGGGSLLILWLTLVLGYPQHQARILNLLFFLPGALIATLFRWKQGQIDMKKVIPAVIAGCICAAAASIFSENFDAHILKKGFGLLLLVTGARELLYKKQS